MNTINKFTIRSLKLNKKRTIVTIIGITLSVALICAVAGMVFSFQASIIEHEIKYDGRWHSAFKEVDEKSIDVVANNKKIESYYYTQNLGYAKYNTTSDLKPYLYLIALNHSALQNSGLELIDGTFPEEENEIVITKEVNRNANQEYKIGDFLNLAVFDLKLINENYEEHIEIFTKEYKIVGVVENISYHLDPYQERGINVITYTKNPTNNINLFVMYKKANFVNSQSEILTQNFGLDGTYDVIHNRELLQWSGVFSRETLNTLYTIMGIVMGIIVLTSIFVIKNSFSISIVERNKEYGLLSSIGATKKQIKKNVMFEGLTLGLISIPLGIILGLVATFTLSSIVNVLIRDSSKMQFLYIIPYQAVIFASILGTITIYLSCYSIAKKNSNISPIDRVRSSEDIKVKKNKTKTTRIIKAIFKTGGVIAYKNLQRNKKKYRTTVISMIVSVVIFLTVSTFTNYIFKESTKQYKTMDFNLMITNNEEFEDFYSLTNDIKKLIGNDKSSVVKTNSAIIDDKYINLEFAQYLGYYENQENRITLHAIGVDAYKEYVKKLGGKYEDYKDKGILVDEVVTFVDSKLISGESFKVENKIELKIDNETINLEIIKKTKEVAMPFLESQGSYIVVSDEMIDKIGYDLDGGYMVINSTNIDGLLNDIAKLNNNLNIYNYELEKQNAQNIYLLISIFLYGFIMVITIISITNIINTLTTSINLRRREFAMLKSVGTTSKEFKQMINLESIFLGLKVLIISLPIGMGISYAIYYAISNLNGIFIAYDPNIFSIVVSIVGVFVIVKIIMSYSINKINKQNIIETLRNNNI